MTNLKALYVIVNAGFSSQIVDLINECGGGGATILNARGSYGKSKTILGITIDSEKEIVLSILNKEIADKVVEEIKEKAGVGTNAHGVCYYMPVEMSTIKA